jgi:hypothetical protein
MEVSGAAEPRNEIKYVAYTKGSNVNLSYTTNRIIEKYFEAGSKPEHPRLLSCRESSQCISGEEPYTSYVPSDGDLTIEKTRISARANYRRKEEYYWNLNRKIQNILP